VEEGRVKRVLIVEDDGFNLQLLRAMLKQAMECEVIANDRGSEVLAMLKEEEPKIDMLLLDIYLPEISGDEILREVRKIPHYKDLPIFIISVDGLDERRYLDLGATDFILKPFNPNVLMEKIRKYLD
jgi:two-component system chemotaxis response regulator CheY